MNDSIRFKPPRHKKWGYLPFLMLIVVLSVSHINESSHEINDFDPVRSMSVDEIGNGISYKCPYIDSYSNQFVPTEERKEKNKIRYAALGSSVTWGASLDDRELLTYVRRVSQHDEKRGKNFGIRSTGPNYPAACLYSMIGDEEFDVIILEFFQKNAEGLMTLAKRIRQRFPDAIIIITRLWYPTQLFNYELNMNAGDYAEQLGLGRDFIHDPKFHEAIIQSGPRKWESLYKDPNERHNKIHLAVAQEVGAYIVRLPFDERADTVHGWLTKGDKLLAEDSFHLSKGGHAVLAEEIEEIVDKVGVLKEPRIGEFDGMDHCHNWLESGEISAEIKYSSNGIVSKMPNTQKYALTFSGENTDSSMGDGDGWIEVSNPSNIIMDLNVAYMTTGPAPSKYPKVEVTRTNRDANKIILDPVSTGWRDKKVHVTRLANIGKIYPGVLKDRIYFRPMEETEYPFRLVSVAITMINESENSREKFESLSGGPISITS